MDEGGVMNFMSLHPGVQVVVVVVVGWIIVTCVRKI